MNAISSVLNSLLHEARTINRKYAKPQIEMTPLVRICLFALRFYLFVLVGLLVYKFVITIRQ